MKSAGVWAGIGLLAYSAVLFQQSFLLDYYNPYGPGPGFLPRWLSLLLFIVSAAYVWESIKSPDISLADLLPHDGARLDVALMLIGLCLFALLVESIGFVLAGTQLLFLMTFRKFKWYYALPGSVVVSVVLLVLFEKTLGVSLPVNDFGW